jgi:predicted transcriptional regulator
MAGAAAHITSAELKVLKVIWRIGTGTVRDVLERLPEKGASAPAYTTVMTLMNQLAEKGVLDVDRSRQPFLYQPRLRREQVLTQRLKQFLTSVYDGQAGELVLRLIEEGDFSPEELRRIEEKIEAREKKGAKPGKRKGRREGGAS